MWKNKALNKRSFNRIYIKVPVTYEPVGHAGSSEELRKTVISGDISEGGIYFETDEPIALKSELKVEFKLPKHDALIQAHVRVASVVIPPNENQFGIGMVFTQISEQDKEMIRQLVNVFDIALIMKKAIEKGASDVHLIAHAPPVFRIQRELCFQNMPKLEPDDIPHLIYSIMSRQQIKNFEQTKELDFGYQFSETDRFRINLHVQRGNVEVTLRVITVRNLSFEDLMIPEAVKEFARLKEGMILVTGPTGSGKTTTIAAIVDYINHDRSAVIVTLERPVEYLHLNVKSVVKQREIGLDSSSFSVALQSSLRQDPNVIVVGELDNSETVKTALIAAEAGYLVIASFHAPDTLNAIDRLTSFFPAENRKAVLSQISNCLKGVVSQYLIPGKDGKKMLLASEILIGNAAAKKTIRNDELIQLPSVIQMGKSSKMQSMADSIRKYRDAGLISVETAAFYCPELALYQ